jgi:hypothetical protein
VVIGSRRFAEALAQDRMAMNVTALSPTRVRKSLSFADSSREH